MLIHTVFLFLQKKKDKMKKTLLLLLIVLSIMASCSKSEGTANEEYTIYGKNKGGITISSFIQKELSTGEIIEDRINTDVYIFEAKGRDFDPEKSKLDILKGFMWDKTSKKSIKNIAFSLSESSYYELLPAGKYFVYITTGNNIPRLAYSYKYFEVKYKKEVKLKKLFKKDTKGLTHYEW